MLHSYAHINNDQPTTDDRLNRDQYAEAFAGLFATCETPLVVGLYGGWGLGKTSLMKQIEAKLDLGRTVPLWFNLWSHQDDDNPIVSLAQSLAVQCGVRNKATKKLLTLIAVAFGDKLLNHTIGLKIWDLIKIGERYEDENYQKRDAKILLRSHFQALVNQLRGGTKKRLIIFLDDIDRCMPDKTLRILEALKLYLDLPGCVFVLALDHHVVRNAISIQYKDLAFKESDYLDKIIQLPFTVPPIEPLSMASFLEPLLPQDLQGCKQILVTGLGENPRQVKRLVNILVFNHRLAAVSEIRNYDPKILAFLLLIQLQDPEQYRKLVQGTDSLADASHPLITRCLNCFPQRLEGLDLKPYLYLTRVNNPAESIYFEPLQRAGLTNPVLAGRHILWVDDQGLLGSEGTEQLLLRLGASLEIVKSSDAAKQAISKRKPDIIISDISRGNDHEAGFKMVSEFRELGTYKGLVFFFTSSLRNERVKKATELGAMVFTDAEGLIKELTATLQTVPSTPDS